MEGYPILLRYFVFTMGIFATFPSKSGAFSQGSIGGLFYVNFMINEFSYLNITSIGRNFIQDENDCGYACLEIPSCFSYNVAAFPGDNGKLLCELLPSDKYNNSDKFNASEDFHHFYIPKSKEEPGKFRPTSCVDYLRRGSSKNGTYKLFYNNGGNSYKAYCDLKSEPGTAWTLVMSWISRNRNLPECRSTPFKKNAPVNENAPNWNQYRLSLARMKLLQDHSTHWRATCSYPTHGIDFRDYLRGTFKDFNIVDYIGEDRCQKVEYINIRGHVGKNLTVPFWQYPNQSLHTDSWPGHSVMANCTTEFSTKAGSGAVYDEDNFGWYASFNSKFRCTQGNQSTTQWWFGAHL